LSLFVSRDYTDLVVFWETVVNTLTITAKNFTGFNNVNVTVSQRRTLQNCQNTWHHDGMATYYLTTHSYGKCIAFRPTCILLEISLSQLTYKNFSVTLQITQHFYTSENQ